MLRLLKTPEAWGEQQAERYLNALAAGMEQLRRMPNLGKSRNTVRVGYRSLQVGRHVIYYRVQDDAIDIVRVLHDRMDPDVQIGAGHSSG